MEWGMSKDEKCKQNGEKKSKSNNFCEIEKDFYRLLVNLKDGI